ncbi:MAG: hypothetical protein A2725_04165 [Candidatus Magasanikbacteria bacterium RIFCSPHIGHO2_01_FULL_33_34]|uniref:Uncharacterized protein n=1 Tax=Candidatus Magasanikbacteria bacterium RIFCSPHIGHO2_01_FULL_33_34 TaxID=1798671 RepID=A0A1F6LHY5_9BACT|nr:MAG: hypothetical protein A2725_04165 [Candidatus Magasanikbacteria bacterium RIFCSPHIGHO2_01_FULL_33_34]OGH65161.1 MAG: hypothetical protein A3B83_03925 [Candidatus Magasanikbacteria bacterium RIFCSPHIGHO2_02_FULL_33_17]OGH75295.1 MAG: hypothetical protein A3A89_04240 [Candidatus Magasanikbacteria bacterium RIFCSPLOWO2_01_FULL_33_34]
MLSQKTLTALLVIAVFALSYQTVTLGMMSKKLETAKIGIGASPTAINLTDDGGTAPAMVGGC